MEKKIKMKEFISYGWKSDFSSLILINMQELYNKYKMNYNYLWLEVFDKYKNEWLSNRFDNYSFDQKFFYIK